MIQQHLRYTKSKLAAEVLANFDALLPKFVKVFPATTSASSRSAVVPFPTREAGVGVLWQV